jgi:hypothetical protein
MSDRRGQAEHAQSRLCFRRPRSTGGCRAHIGEFWRAGTEQPGAGSGRVITCQPRTCRWRAVRASAVPVVWWFHAFNASGSAACSGWCLLARAVMAGAACSGPSVAALAGLFIARCPAGSGRAGWRVAGRGGAFVRRGRGAGRRRRGRGGGGTRSGRWCCAARRWPTGPGRRGRRGRAAAARPCGRVTVSPGHRGWGQPTVIGSVSAGTQVSQLLSLKVTALPAIRAVRSGGRPGSLPGQRRSPAGSGWWHQPAPDLRAGRAGCGEPGGPPAAAWQAGAPSRRTWSRPAAGPGRDPAPCASRK